MEPIYVTGHRNPDTDSIVSAMAYAALRNAIGDREYVAARLGHISDETRRILDRFGMEPPVHIHTVRTQIRDLDYDTPPVMHQAVPIRSAWEALQDQTAPAIPISREDGTLYGMLSPTDVAKHDMNFAAEPYLENVPVFNLLSVLEGHLVGEGSNLVDTVTGEVVAALPGVTTMELKKETIFLCGQQPEMVRAALEAGVSCIILCQAQLPEDLDVDRYESTCILNTPLDACRVSHLLFQAMPVERICRSHDLEHVHLDDFLDDVREIVLRSRYRSYPILDEADRVVGTLSRYHMIRPRRKRVVLVDHNEFAQSVPGLDQAEILEIIDHHRLADIQTGGPIHFRNEPVGSTATIVASMYQERGLMPSKSLAGLMAAAIISDTVLFKSPTATDRDRRMAQRMARIAGVTLEDLGQVVFSAGNVGDRSAEELLLSDFKEFHIAGHYLAVGQITCVDSHLLISRREEFLQAMAEQQKQHGYGLVILMLTDVLLAGSHLLYLGDEEAVRHAFNVDPRNEECFLPKIISRKKQIVPMLSALWG